MVSIELLELVTEQTDKLIRWLILGGNTEYLAYGSIFMMGLIIITVLSALRWKSYINTPTEHSSTSERLLRYFPFRQSLVSKYASTMSNDTIENNDTAQDQLGNLGNNKIKLHGIMSDRQWYSLSVDELDLSSEAFLELIISENSSLNLKLSADENTSFQLAIVSRDDDIRFWFTGPLSHKSSVPDEITTVFKGADVQLESSNPLTTFYNAYSEETLDGFQMYDKKLSRIVQSLPGTQVNFTHKKSGTNLEKMIKVIRDSSFDHFIVNTIRIEDLSDKSKSDTEEEVDTELFERFLKKVYYLTFGDRSYKDIDSDFQFHSQLSEIIAHNQAESVLSKEAAISQTAYLSPSNNDFRVGCYSADLVARKMFRAKIDIRHQPLKWLIPSPAEDPRRRSKTVSEIELRQYLQRRIDKSDGNRL